MARQKADPHGSDRQQLLHRAPRHGTAAPTQTADFDIPAQHPHL